MQRVFGLFLILYFPEDSTNRRFHQGRSFAKDRPWWSSGRVGKVDDHYELVGAETFSVKELDKKSKDSFKEFKGKLDPMIAYEVWREGKGE